jgi:hypothetical protein
MFQRYSLILSLLTAMIAAPSIPAAIEPLEATADVLEEDPKSEYAPILERGLQFHAFAYRTLEGAPFDLRDYAKEKRVVIIEYFAGWCANSNRNGHIVERLWKEYRERGLGVVGVAEYSDAGELRIHINRIGIDYPVVIETSKRDQRKDSLHYKYRRAVGDKRKWGTPFYVIIDTRDIEAALPNAPMARRVYTVSGEIVEAEADQFIRQRIADFKRQ